MQDDDGWTLPIELIGGEAVVMSPSGVLAAHAQGELYLALRQWQHAVGDRGLLLQDVFVRLMGNEHALAPDLAWWSGARRPPIVPGAIGVVPDLVVEVLSPGTAENDRGPKRAIYERAGVAELWLVDPQERTVQVLPEGRDPREELESDLLPGFRLPVRTLFDLS